MTEEEKGIARRKQFRDNQNYFSEKISDLTRYIGFGLVALAFSLLSTNTDFSAAVVAAGPKRLVWIGLMGCVALLFDYLQLVFGWWASGAAADNEQDGYKLTRAGKRFRALQTGFFYLKQVLVIVGALLLLCLIYSAIAI